MTSVDTAAAWTWVDHLRAGGTTAWTSWLDAHRGTDDPRSGDRLLPGAQQLELVRRLNEVGRPGSALVERVLVASAPGRGRQDLELVGAVRPLAFGPRPIDPATLTPADLVRVAVGLIAEDVVAAGGPPPEPVRTRRWRTRYRLAGDPWIADAMRAELVSQGRPPGGRGAVVAIVATDLATLLAHEWATRCFGQGTTDWEGFVAETARRDRLPRRVDLARSAARWAEEGGGPQQVRVVTDPRAVPKVVGVRRLVIQPDVSAVAAELARRIAGAVGLLVTPPEQTRLLRTVLRPRLGEAPGPPVAVPLAHREWLEEHADRVGRRLRAGGYPVVGDLDALRPRWPDARDAGSGGPDARPDTGLDTGSAPPESVLALALDLLVRPAPAIGGDT